MCADRRGGSREVLCEWNGERTQVAVSGVADDGIRPIRCSRGLFVQKDSMPGAFSQKEETSMSACTELYQCDLGVPSDTGKLFFAGFPFAAGEDARGDVDQTGDEAEDGGGGPGAAVARAVITNV